MHPTNVCGLCSKRSAIREDCGSSIADVFVGGVLSTRSAWVIGGLSLWLGLEPRGSATFPSACFCASTVFMRKQTVLAKKKRGPAPTGIGVQVVVRMQPAPLAALDDWLAKQDDNPSRAEAIRRLVELALKKK